MRSTVFLARMFTRAKWKQCVDLGSQEIPADAVTCDLKTRDNTLSFWQCGEGTDEEVSEAALAIATGRDRLDKLDVVWVKTAELTGDSLTTQQTAGRTPVLSLVGEHVDVIRLDFQRLGKVAYRISLAIEQECWSRLSKKQVANIIAAAVRQGRVSLTDLKEKLQVEIAKIADAAPEGVE